MYKIIIADDEKLIRQGLKNVLNWSEVGFEITGIFSDGQEVIESLEYTIPDVILTDIRMAHISGIDIAKYVYENQLHCKVILISGYKEFDLALQGLKYGAKDYLLKPTNVDNLIDTITKVKNELDLLNLENQKIQADKERIDEVLPLLEERFFSDLILGVVDSDDYIKHSIKILYPDITIEDSPCILADIYIENYEEFMSTVWEYNFDQFEVNIANFLRIFSEEISFYVVYKSGNMIEIFGVILGLTDKNSLENKAEHIISNVMAELRQCFGFQGICKLRRVYKTILEIRILRNILWDGKQESIQPHLQEQKKLLMSNISLGNIVTAQKIFHNIMQELRESPTAYRNNMVIDILSTLNDILKEVNTKLSMSLQSYFNYSLILSFTDSEDINAYCDRIFDRIKLAEEKKEYYDTSSLVSKAKAYILKNIDKDISQEETANQLYICSSYLSRLFKKQTGESFTQYVTRMKVEKAIELLKNPKYKAYQVSEALGYKTPRYFSRLFRMQTGMNPSEYRGKVLQLGGGSDEI